MFTKNQTATVSAKDAAYVAAMVRTYGKQEARVRIAARLDRLQVADNDRIAILATI